MSDLGNVGVQRSVVRYESAQRFTDPDPTWFAVLDCGHKRKLSAEPGVGEGRAQAGRYMDCDDCTALSKAQS